MATEWKWEDQGFGEGNELIPPRWCIVEKEMHRPQHLGGREGNDELTVISDGE